MTTFARATRALNNSSSVTTKSKKGTKNPNYPTNIVIWNHDHLLVKLIESYGILEPERAIQIQQKDFLISFLIGMMKTYCSPKNNNPDESVAEFYFRYVKGKYQVKVQVAKMCNSFAYSMQCYAKGDQEIKHIYDLFGVNAALQLQIAAYLKVREIITTYLSNALLLDNVNFGVEQWSALLNRIFRGQQASNRALLEKIQALQVSLPQRHAKFILKATQLLELSVEELTTFRYSRPRNEDAGIFLSEGTRNFLEQQQSESLESGFTQIAKFRNQNFLKQQTLTKALETESKIPFDSMKKSYNYQTEEDYGSSPRHHTQDDADYNQNTVQTLHDQYYEFEERDPKHELKVSEAYQIEDLKRDRAYLKHQISKITAEKHESRLNTIQVLELYDELMTKHKHLIEFTEEVQKQMSYSLCLIKSKDKDVFKAVDPEIVKRFLSHSIELPLVLELNDPEQSKMIMTRQAAESMSPGKKKKKLNLGNQNSGQKELLEMTKPEPKILRDPKSQVTKAPQVSGTSNKAAKKAALVNEILSKVYNKALKNDKVMDNRLKERIQRAKKIEVQREFDLQLEYSSHGIIAMDTSKPVVDFTVLAAIKAKNKEIPNRNHLRTNILATRESTEDVFETEETKMFQTSEEEISQENKNSRQKSAKMEETQNKSNNKKEEKEEKDNKIKIEDNASVDKPSVNKPSVNKPEMDKDKNVDSSIQINKEKGPEKPSMEGVEAQEIDSLPNTIQDKKESQKQEKKPEILGEKKEEAQVSSLKQNDAKSSIDSKDESSQQAEVISKKKEETNEKQPQKDEDIQEPKPDQSIEREPNKSEGETKNQTQQAADDKGKTESTQFKKEEEAVAITQPKQQEDPKGNDSLLEKTSVSAEKQQEVKVIHEEVKTVKEEIKLEEVETSQEKQREESSVKATKPEELQSINKENQAGSEKKANGNREETQEQASQDVLEETPPEKDNKVTKTEEKEASLKADENEKTATTKDKVKEVSTKQENFYLLASEKADNKPNDLQPIQANERLKEQENPQTSETDNRIDNKQDITEKRKEELLPQEEEAKKEDMPSKTEEKPANIEEPDKAPVPKFKAPIFKPPNKR